MIKVNLPFVMVSSLLVWLLMMLVPYASMRSWEDYSRILSSGPPIVYQATGVLVFCATVFICRPASVLWSVSLEKIGSTRSLFLLFCLYTGALALWSIDRSSSLVFTVLHVSVFGCFVAMWRMAEGVDRFLPVLGIALFVALVGLGVALGVRGRTFGFMPPNDIAKLAMVASVFCAFGGKRIRTLGFLTGLAFVLMTQSRGTLIAYGIFWGLLTIGGRLTAYRLMLILMGLGVGAAALLLDQIATHGRIFGGLLNAVFLLDDIERGTGSGLTGRLDHWIVAQQVIAQEPLFGHGLRTRGTFHVDPYPTPDLNAHSGYLNMILDVGFVGAALLLTTIFLNMKRRMKRDQNRSFADARRNRICVSFMLAGLFIWGLEPIYINLGAPFSLVMLLLLAAPIRSETARAG